MYHRVALLGSPGTGKSTMGLSYPGVEQHVYGSSEESTIANFRDRKDILPPVKFDWFETLTPQEQAQFTDEKVTELVIADLTKKGRAKNVARYRRYLYKLKADLLAKNRPEVQTILLDNLTPFADEFADYIEVVWQRDFVTEKGNFDSIAYYKRFRAELTDFLRLFFAMPCHAVLTCHVSMALGEETVANTKFLELAKTPVKKEWLPMLTGQAKFVLAGIPDWVFFLKVEERSGLPNKYIAKLEADESVVGIAKPRINPFKNARQLTFPKGEFFATFQRALETYQQTGQAVALAE